MYSTVTRALIEKSSLSAAERNNASIVALFLNSIKKCYCTHMYFEYEERNYEGKVNKQSLQPITQCEIETQPQAFEVKINWTTETDTRTNF
jgi:hypothetical protein